MENLVLLSATLERYEVVVMPDIDGIVIKGYFTDTGYMGHIGNGKYMLFADETDYLDYMEMMY